MANLQQDDIAEDYNAEWNEQHEKILVEWADKAICYRWLHSKSRIKYNTKNTWFTIPVIIMSTLTGTANFAIDRIPEEYKGWYTVGVGSINIFAGILTTIQQFLKISELNEAHRTSSISWDKFYRNIKLELAKSREERMPAFQMLKMSKEEFDRLMETSPPITESIIRRFNTTFSGGEARVGKELNERQKSFNQLYKPEICDTLETTANFVYRETAQQIEKSKTKTLADIVNRNKEYTKNYNIVNQFIQTFKTEYSREPSQDEIYDNLSNKIDKIQIDKITDNINIKIEG
tara:strand:+ start:958 stop:1827 length:870 start_codon:yes stop_codon:yes gene_type:complete